MLDIEKLRTYQIPDTHTELTRRDTILYALGVGLGSGPTDAGQLQFLRSPILRALPTMATVIATPYDWISAAAVGHGGKTVHAGIHVKLHGELPVEGQFVGHNALDEVLDKGPGKAAIVSTRREVVEVETGRTICTILNTNMYRGDGGFGGASQSARAVAKVPARAPDVVCDMPTLPQQALLYQLSGDYNPLHSDPETARAQGFDRPILHGLASFGITGHAILARLCGYDPAKLTAIGGHFTRPVFPGEPLRVKLWVEGTAVAFQTTVPKREDVVVLDHGTATLACAV